MTLHNFKPAGIKTSGPQSDPKGLVLKFFFFLSILSACEYAAFYFLATCSTRFRNASAYPGDWLAIVFARHSFVMRIAMGWKGNGEIPDLLGLQDI